MEIPPYIEKWERDLGTKKDKNIISKILNRTFNLTLDTQSAEMNYKCISRSYLTPEILSKYQAGSTALCWRGCHGLGTMGHIWWSCPKIKIFWKRTLALIKIITNIEVAEDPWVVLFHGWEGDTKKYKQTLIPFLLNAAKRLIPRGWQRKESPETWEWFDAIEETYNNEELVNKLEEKDNGTLAVWEQWKQFKKTWRYVKELKALD